MSFSTRHLVLLLLLTSSLGLYSCKQQGQGTADIQLEDVEKLLKEVISNHEYPIKEWEKLHQVEYKVLRFAVNSSASDMENKLNALGKKRWNCNNMQRVTVKDSKMELIVFCSRGPKTPLRYFPRKLFGIP